jgi:hypothetical protein
MSNKLSPEKLKFYLDNEFNVLFEGKHGVGKTAKVIEAFEAAKLNWLYFSASTLDPWVDFIGVPKEVKNPKTGEKYLDLVRPKAFAEDKVEAIFLDEYNRSHKKIRNAAMELIQFKSINGKKFKNLKVVWAAINPEEEDDEESGPSYDVEALDPAQKDRFHVLIDVPYKPDKVFFKKSYGEKGCNACDWWEELDDKAKNEISPRRLEYGLKMNSKGGDLRDVLPACANVSKLLHELEKGSFKKNLVKVFKKGEKEEAKAFINDVNNYSNCIPDIVKNNDYMLFFLPHLNAEKLASLMSSDPAVRQFIREKVNNKPASKNKADANVAEDEDVDF